MKAEYDDCSECYAQDVPCVALGESPYMQPLCQNCLAQAYLKLCEAATSEACSALPEMVPVVIHTRATDGFVRIEFEFPHSCPAPKERVEVFIEGKWKSVTFATKGWDLPTWTGFQITPTTHNVGCRHHPRWRHRKDAKYKGTCNGD